VVISPIAQTEERPITFKDLQDFEERIERKFNDKLDELREAFLSQLAGKASYQDIDIRVRPVQQQLDTLTASINKSNDVGLEVKGALNEIRANSSERLDRVRETVIEMRTSVEFNERSLAGMVSDVNRLKGDLYGAETGQPPGLFRAYQSDVNRLNDTLTALPEQQAKAMVDALAPLVGQLSVVEMMVRDHHLYITTRRNIESTAFSIGKRTWSWLTTRSTGTRIGTVIALGAAIGAMTADQPVGQFIALLVRYVLRIP